MHEPGLNHAASNGQHITMLLIVFVLARYRHVKTNTTSCRFDPFFRRQVVQRVVSIQESLSTTAVSDETTGTPGEEPRTLCMRCERIKVNAF